MSGNSRQAGLAGSAATIPAVPERQPLKILFVMEHPGVGSLVPALHLLNERGHRIELGYQGLKSVESQRELQSFADECPGTVFHELPAIGHSRDAALASWLRRSIDYLRYLEPRYRDAVMLRRRARRKAPKSMRQIGRAASWLGPAGVAGLRGTLQAVERCLPPSPAVVAFLEEHRPDILLPSHLLPIGTTHADYLRAAKRLGIRTVFPVRGWDNLTNKGLLRDAPDRVLAWNDLQAKEAVELHRVPPENITLVGAALCDAWFEWSPSRSREDFCREVGLRPDKPIVLYVCSSGFVAKAEVGFVRDWIRKLRARGEPFADAGFLVRPHPLNAAQWADADLDDPHATVWPRFGEAPHDDESRQNYFDSIYHSAAVVGINTTAQIESAIVGRPVHTLLAEEFRDTQQGTLHFHYLQADEFGLLFVGRDFEEHAEQLAESVRGRADDGRNERFLKRFVRPRGLDRPARELIVEAVEELGYGPAPAPDPGPEAAPVVRVAVAPFAAIVAAGETRRRARRASRHSAAADLRRNVRKRAMHRAGAPVVAGPWLDDELGELLYWIPFLRWTEGLGPGLSERLFVVSRASSTAWYEGLGAGVVALEELTGKSEPGRVGEDELQGSLRDAVASAFGLGPRAFRVLPAELVAATRSDLSRQKPNERTKRRLLHFAPLATPDPPAGLDLPDSYLAVRFDPEQAEIGAVLAEREAVVDLSGLGRPAQTAAIGRARGFVGSFGVEAIVAVLAGVPAVAFPSAVTPFGDDERKVVTALLSEPPFGALHLPDAPEKPAEAAKRAAKLLEDRVEALAPV